MERPKITIFISSCNLTHWSIVSIIHPAIWPIRQNLSNCLISSFYIKPQLSWKTGLQGYHCLISSFYIKPQLAFLRHKEFINCLISSFYIKPQLSLRLEKNLSNCLISSFYIKPQLSVKDDMPYNIVLYRLSTSNHNLASVVI